jgi:RimJ/RimL family protein N-acetyltransferase
VLRPFREDDLEPLLAIRNRPEVWRWLLRREVDPRSYGDALRAVADDPLDHSVVVELDGTVIGTGSLEVRDAMGQDAGGPSRRAEGLLGYILDPATAGRGYATELASALLAVAFDELLLHRVTAGCFAANAASWRVMEKVGMRREQHGVQDSWHAELGWVDGYTYAILAEEWHARTGAP